EIDAISVAAVALSGRVLSLHRRQLPDAPAARTAVVRITELVDELRTVLPFGTIEAGLGVAVPGQVEDANGVVTESLPLHWANVNLASELNGRLGIPVFVDNDARLSLRSAQRRGIARSEQNIVYLHGRASGISGAIVADGELLRGRSGLAGAVGLIRVHSDRLGSLHEHPGTLDALVRRDELVEALGAPEASDDELRTLLAAPLRGRPARVVREQTSWLASGLATIVNLFNPDAIVLDGFLVALFESRMNDVLEQCASESVARSFETVRFVCEPSAHPSEILGAAELPLQAVIADPLALTRMGRPLLHAVPSEGGNSSQSASASA
ncbi:MAG TPA: ROK family protein, partial [Microbacteriaceae bacterium]|nr:ROK family protein [Microbacteriaceae bacterium]